MDNTTLEGFRLSPQQRRFFASRTAAAGNSVALIRIDGPLEIGALKRAVSEVMQRHEILRTNYRRWPGMTMPLQVITNDVHATWLEIDRRNDGESGGAISREALFSAEQTRAFDLERGAMLHVTLVTVAEQQYELLLTLPAICSDTLSLSNLVQDICAHYDGSGRMVAAQEEPVQYLQYSEWQNEEMQTEASEEQQKVWSNWRPGVIQELRLPNTPHLLKPGHPMPGVLRHALPHGMREKLAAVTAEGHRKADALLACWGSLVSRLTLSAEATLGVTFDGRVFDELADSMGNFARTLPFRMEIDAGATFTAILAQVHATSDDLADKQVYFAPGILEVDGEPVRFALAFEYEARPAPFSAGAITFHAIEQVSCSEPADLVLKCVAEDSGVNLEFFYAPQCYAETDIQRIAAQFETLLESALSQPDIPIERLTLLPVEQRNAILQELSHTQPSPEPDRCLHRLIEMQAARTPDAPAVAFEGETLTYRQLNERANQLAQELLSMGADRDAIVGLFVHRSLDMIVGLVGILKAGAAYLPLDPALPADRLAYMQDDARVLLTVTQSELAPSAALQGRRVFCLDGDAEQARLREHSAGNPEVACTPSDLAYVIYTSGSTGLPKGVAIEHRNIVNYVAGVSARLGLEEGARYALVSTIAADLGLTVLYPALCSGGCLHVIAARRVSDPDALAAYFRAEAIDCLKIVPSHLRALLSGSDPAGVLPRQVLVLGGEACRWDLVERIRALSSELRILNHYGPTETTVGVLTYPMDIGLGGRALGSATVPLGRPLPGCQVYILDTQGEPTPLGVPGELYIGGRGVARGYLGREALTQERFVADAWGSEPGSRLYRTGDRVRWLSSGDIEFLGRFDDQVKIRGYRIELGEVEAALRKLPGVKDCAVVCSAEGDAEPQILGYVAGESGVSGGALRASLADVLPDYMVPSVVIVLERLPLTANGKLDRRGLPSPDSVTDNRSSGTETRPRTHVEQTLADIWEALLGAPQRDVHADFFEQGGHSLLAIQVISRIRNTFQVELPLETLFNAPTIAGLAEHITASRPEDGSEAPPMVRVSRDTPLPLSFAQQRLWFVDQFEPGNRFYTNPYCFRLSGPLDVRALQDSLTEIGMRHEVLRSSYSSYEGLPIQIISEEAPAPMAFVDLSDLPEAERNEAANRLLADSCDLRFDLAEGRLFRAQLIKLTSEEHLLLIIIHHIVWDGASTNILLKELSALYDAFSFGRPSPLPRLDFQYPDYAVWQREFVKGRVTDVQLSYWRSKLGGADFGLPVRTDRPEAAAPTFAGGMQTFSCPSDIAMSLGDLAQRERASNFIVMLAAFNALLYQDSRQNDICVGTPVSGRRWTETENLIGLFLNTLVIRSQVSGELSFRELVRQVRDTVLAAHANQDLPFEQVVDTLRPQRDMSHTPLFRLWFTYGEASTPIVEFNGLSVQAQPPIVLLARYALRMNLAPMSDGGLQGLLIYQTDLFEAETIQGMSRKMESLLSMVASDADIPLSHLVEQLSAIDRQIQDEQALRLDEMNRQRIGGRARTAIKL